MMKVCKCCNGKIEEFATSKEGNIIVWEECKLCGYKNITYQHQVEE